MRCLKRYVAREVYRALTHPFDLPEPDVSGRELREARLMADMRQKDVAGILGMSVPSVSKVERGLASERSGTYRTYLKWYRDGMPTNVEKKNQIGT